MKSLVLGFLFVLFSNMAWAGCQLSGEFTITGDWTSFSEWYVTLENGKLVDSYTDDLSASDWPTTLELQHETYLKLSQTTYGSDAIIDTVIHLKVVSCNENNVELIPMYGYETYLDETDSSDPASVFNTTGLSIQKF